MPTPKQLTTPIPDTTTGRRVLEQGELTFGVDCFMGVKSLFSLALILSLQTPVFAQSGFTLFGGERDPDSTLTYSMTNNRARARLNLLDLQMHSRNVAMAEIRVTYSYFYDQSFDVPNIQVLDETTRTPYPIENIEVDKESRILRIFMVKPIPAETAVRLRMNNFTNPRSGGIFKLLVHFVGTEPNPIPKYAGSWNISFN
jgi:Protein of unknown function (DUF2808)